MGPDVMVCGEVLVEDLLGPGKYIFNTEGISILHKSLITVFSVCKLQLTKAGFIYV